MSLHATANTALPVGCRSTLLVQEGTRSSNAVPGTICALRQRLPWGYSWAEALPLSGPHTCVIAS